MRNPDKPWVLPHLSVARTRAELLRLKKRHRAPFHRSVKHADGYHFYHSHEPNALCVGEGIKQDILSQLHHLGLADAIAPFLYLEHLGEEQWYAVKLHPHPSSALTVVKEWLGSWSEVDNALAFDWHQGTPVMTSSLPALSAHLEATHEPIVISQPDIDEKACELGKATSISMTLTASGALLMLGSLALWHFSTATSPAPPPVLPSAYELRMQAYQTEVKPSDALRTLSGVLAYLPFLPNGLTPDSITLSPANATWNVTLIKASTLQHRLWEAFAERHSNFAQYAHLNDDTIRLVIPIKTHNTERIYNISGFQAPLMYTLERMGYTIKERQQKAAPLTITEWQLDTDRFFETLPVLIELTDSPALSLTHFEMESSALLSLTTKTHSGETQPASLSLTLQGTLAHEDKGPLNH